MARGVVPRVWLVVPRAVVGGFDIRGAARWLLHRPGAQLVLGAIVIAVAFPASAAGSVALTILAGALGVLAMHAWPHAPASWRAPSPRVATAIVLAIVAAVGVVTFWDTLTITPDWQMGDWGPQHAALARIMPSLPGLDVPVWNHVIQTGDAPLELYPALTYLITGHTAVALGLEDNLPLAFMVVAVIVHLSLALLTTAVAARIAPRPVALVVGLFTLVDSGAISHGGTVGLFHWALLHSALAHVFSMIAALGVLAALRRPRLGASVAIWVGTALGTAAHPAALITAAACGLALIAAAIFAADMPPRRALIALLHVAIGCALGAIVWLPASERLIAYGQHFSNDLLTGSKMLANLLSWASPITSYSLIVYAGYLGIIAGLWSRRGEVIFIAAVALILLLGMWDAPYLAFGLAPSSAVARLGSARLMLLTRPFSFAIGAYGFAVILRGIQRAWRGADLRQRTISAALLGVVACAGFRIAPDFWRGEEQRATDEARVFAPDPEGRALLTSWAKQQVAAMTPQHWARALFEEDTHEHLHLTAETGLPTLHATFLPDMLLRERIEDTSPASLARFDVRWVVAINHSPSLGEPASEQTFGSYHVREIAAWDGKFARIERGSGDVTVTRLDDREVDVEVTGTTEPVVVALGTGFYPRWTARHASGADEPVYALPTVTGGALHVVSAVLLPGKTAFTCDGPLPSDGAGRVPAFGAFALALAIIVTWSHRRPRRAVLRQLAALRGRARRLSPWAAPIGVPLLLGVLLVRGCHDELRVTPALQVGSGVRGTVTVEARVRSGNWQRCDYTRVTGEYRCDGLGGAWDAMATLMTDVPPSWNFTTPSINLSADVDDVDLRLKIPAHLAGRYWAAAAGGTGTITIAGEPVVDLDAVRSTFEVEDKGEREVVIVVAVPTGSGTQLSVVAADTIDPPRPFLHGLTPPPSP